MLMKVILNADNDYADLCITERCSCSACLGNLTVHNLTLDIVPAQSLTGCNLQESQETTIRNIRILIDNSLDTGEEVISNSLQY